MTVSLGIDTGGTYTDAVLVHNKTGEVLSSAKSLTTRQDLSVGIKKAIASVFEAKQNASHQKSVSLVALSTTLATNAIAEGHGVPVSLILIGYDQELIQKYQFHSDLVTDDVIFINGGHDIKGDEVEPLDELAAKQAILQRLNKAKAFAISGYFGALNPTHELRVRELVEELSDLPVTCGHELSTRLNSIRRATTVTLNARLIPLLKDLIASVRRTLEELSITAPLMVVKGDGSLVRAEWALQRPIETVLSGPAASAIGAWQLAGKSDVWAIDVGGTTTDIVELVDGKPKLNPDGANIGGWRTMVEAADVFTIGLGGDSHVRHDQEAQLLIGPQRVIPLCKLASEYPEVMEKLLDGTKRERFSDEAAQFLISWTHPDDRFSDRENTILRCLEDGPRSIGLLVRRMLYDDPLVPERIKSLENMYMVQRAGFTPTDALHVLGRFRRWNVEASRLGAQILAQQSGLPIVNFCERIVRRVSEKAAIALVSKVLEDNIGAPNWKKEPTATALLDLAINDIKGNTQEQIGCEITLRRPLVALGAPVEEYIPRTADTLHTKLLIPPYAEVANALGAVSGGVIQRFRVSIRSLDSGHIFRIHLSEGSKDIVGLEHAVSYARDFMFPCIETVARKAGAEQVEIEMDRTDKRVKLKGNQEVYLGTELFFTAFGRPSPARR